MIDDYLEINIAGLSINRDESVELIKQWESAKAAVDAYLAENGAESVKSDKHLRPDINALEFGPTDKPYPLDNHNPYHLQWAYEQADGVVKDACEFFDREQSTVLENLITYGVHEPERPPEDQGYRDKERLREVWRNNGGNIQKTAEHFDVSDHTIRNYINRFGLQDETPAYQDPEILEEAFERNDGKIRPTADEFDVARATVRKYLREFGLVSEEPGVNNGEGSTVCGICGRDDFDSSRAKNIHVARSHPDEQEEHKPEPVNPPDNGDDELFGEDGVEINRDEIQSIDIRDYGLPYTKGNLAETLSECSSFEDIGDKFDIPTGDAQKLCSRIGIDDIYAAGRNVGLDELRQRIDIADDKFEPREEESDCGHLEEYKENGECIRCDLERHASQDQNIKNELTKDSVAGGVGR